MELSYAQVEALIADLHSVPSEGRSPLRARLKHLKRLGFPWGVNTGRGKRVAYTTAHVFLLTAMFELLQSGINPELGVALLKHNWPTISKSLLQAHADRIERHVRTPRFVVFEPSVLREMRGFSSNARQYTFVAQDAGELANLISHPIESMLATRLLVLNISAMLLRVEQSAQKLGYSTGGLDDELTKAHEARQSADDIPT